MLVENLPKPYRMTSLEPKGEEFKKWVMSMKPNLKELAEQIGYSRPHLYKLFKSETVDWRIIRKVDLVLSKRYQYDIKEFFPTIPSEQEFYMVEDKKIMYGNESNQIHELRRKIESLEFENTSLTKKLNIAYETIINQTYPQMLEQWKLQMEITKTLIDRSVK